MISGIVAMMLAGGIWAAESARPASLGYVLQAESLGPTRQAVVRRLAACGRDWIVVDAAYGGDPAGAWRPDEVQAIRAGMAGRRVLAYLSIGEAETYRPYWKAAWDANHDGRPDAGAPAWLESENPQWKGNYRVRYWQAEWQAIILAELDARLQAGFDGVYLDIVDGFEFFEYDEAARQWVDNRCNPETGRTYREEMIAWVTRIAAQARRVRPGFLVVPQNGVQLLEDAAYRATIDAIGVEDLFTEGNRLQPGESVSYRCGFLRGMVQAGKPVLDIEYGTHPPMVERAVRGAGTNGFVCLVTDRDLKTLGRSGPSALPVGPGTK